MRPNRLAAAGYVALAPDVYHGQETTEPDEAGKLMMALALETTARDMSAAVDHLAGLSMTVGKGIGVIGFCMGGGLALWLSTLNSKVTACVPFYGAIPWPNFQPDYADSVAAYLGHYAEHDGWATLDSARHLERQLRQLGREVEFHVYPHTEHAFFNDARPEVYNAEASKLAWQRTLAFLRGRIG